MSGTDDSDGCFVADDMSWAIVSGSPNYWSCYGGAATKATFNNDVQNWPNVLSVSVRKFMRHDNPGGTGHGKLWAAGYDGLHYSSDADHTGDSWSKHATVTGILQDIVMSGDVWMAPNLTGCWVTTNAGTFNFRSSTQGMTAGEQYSALIVGSTLWVGGVNGISKSTDGGANWTTYTTTNGLKHNCTRGLAYDPNYTRIWAAADNSASGGLSYTDNSGSNWSTVALTSLTEVKGVIYKDNRIYAWGKVAANGNGIAYSDNGGTTWTYAKAKGVDVSKLFFTTRGG